MVAAIHGADLRYGYMALVDYEQKILGKIIEQAEWAHTGLASIEIARIVLDAWAVAQFAYHLNVVLHALFQAFSLGGAPLLGKEFDLPHQIVLNVAQSLLHARLARYEDVGGVDYGVLERLNQRTAHRVEQFEGFHLVAPEDDAQGTVAVGEVDIDRIAAHTEGAALEIDLVAGIEPIDQRAQKGVAHQGLPHLELHGGTEKIFGIANAVEARH